MADYSSIGKKTSQSLTDIYKTTQQNSLDVTNIVNTSNDIRTSKRKAALNANKKLHEKGFQAYANKQEADATRKNNEKINAIEAPSKRFAGVVAGLGSVSAGAISIKNRMQQKKEDDALQAQFDALKAEDREIRGNLDDQIADILKKQTDLIKQSPEAPGSYLTTTGSTTAGSEVSSNPNVGVSSGSVLPTPSSSSSTLTGDQEAVASRVRAVESGQWGYNAFNQGGSEGGYKAKNSGHYGQDFGTNLTDMTLGQVMEKQADASNYSISDADFERSGGIWAAGAYQFIPDTLKGVVQSGNFDTNRKFDSKLQDELFAHHVKQGGGSLQPWYGLHGAKDFGTLQATAATAF